jgi:hypothetical protein
MQPSDKLLLEAESLSLLVLERHKCNNALAFKLIKLVDKHLPWGWSTPNTSHECMDNLIKGLLGEESMGVQTPYLRIQVCKAILAELHDLMNKVAHPIPIVQELVLWRLSGQEEQDSSDMNASIKKWKKSEGV